MSIFDVVFLQLTLSFSNGRIDSQKMLLDGIVGDAKTRFLEKPLILVSSILDFWKYRHFSENDIFAPKSELFSDSSSIN